MLCFVELCFAGPFDRRNICIVGTVQGLVLGLVPLFRTLVIAAGVLDLAGVVTVCFLVYPILFFPLDRPVRYSGSVFSFEYCPDMVEEVFAVTVSFTGDIHRLDVFSVRFVTSPDLLVFSFSFFLDPALTTRFYSYWFGGNISTGFTDTRFSAWISCFLEVVGVRFLWAFSLRRWRVVVPAEGGFQTGVGAVSV